MDKYHPSILKNSDVAGSDIPKYKVKRTKGHPDFVVYYARGDYIGLFIEFKRYTASASGTLLATTTTQEQDLFMRRARVYGYCTAVCRDLKEGIETVEWYLKLPEPALKQKQLRASLEEAQSRIDEQERKINLYKNEIRKYKKLLSNKL